VQRTPNHRLLRDSGVSPPLLVIDLRTTTASDPIMELVYFFVLLWPWCYSGGATVGVRGYAEEISEGVMIVNKKLVMKLGEEKKRWKANVMMKPEVGVR
ncbi:hypothetical protein PIB30_096721, partial [Stylosanthes scabra]|nr:hypothetical protein [Stylosanthes scabra]